MDKVSFLGMGKAHGRARRRRGRKVSWFFHKPADKALLRPRNLLADGNPSCKSGIRI